MEAGRPELDAQVPDILRSWTFAPTEFLEAADGACRLVAPLPQKLVGFSVDALLWVGEEAERVTKQVLAEKSLPTPLTGTNPSRGRSRGSLGP